MLMLMLMFFVGIFVVVDGCLGRVEARGLRWMANAAIAASSTLVVAVVLLLKMEDAVV